jgi:hypothetical protein
MFQFFLSVSCQGSGRLGAAFLIRGEFKEVKPSMEGGTANSV